MESFLNRYRNITVLLLVIFAQLVLLATQVKNDQNVRIIRVWTVTTVMPVARIVEILRGGTVGVFERYILLHNTDAENRRLNEQVGRLKIENIFLRNELNTADRAKALTIFQAHTPSKMVAATIIGAGAATGSKVVFVDVGTTSGIERGMAVVTPDGIAGKVIAAYPGDSQVMLVTDPEFAAGVISQKSGVHGTLKGQGTPQCRLDYVPLEEKVEVGEMLYTSGDDRIFPRGFPVGVVRVVRNAQPFKEILVDPTGLQHGQEDVLIIVQGVHQEVPTYAPDNQQMYIAPAPPPDNKAAAATEAAAPAVPGNTEADRLRAAYKAVGQAQNHTFGEGLPGSKPPDFTKMSTGAGTAAATGNAAPPSKATPPAAAAKPGTGPVGEPAPPPKPQPNSQRQANQAAGAGAPTPEPEQ